jgi:hypothetical protein
MCVCVCVGGGGGHSPSSQGTAYARLDVWAGANLAVEALSGGVGVLCARCARRQLCAVQTRATGDKSARMALCVGKSTAVAVILRWSAAVKV